MCGLGLVIVNKSNLLVDNIILWTIAADYTALILAQARALSVISVFDKKME